MPIGDVDRLVGVQVEAALDRLDDEFNNAFRERAREFESYAGSDGSEFSDSAYPDCNPGATPTLEEYRQQLDDRYNASLLAGWARIGVQHAALNQSVTNEFARHDTHSRQPTIRREPSRGAPGPRDCSKSCGSKIQSNMVKTIRHNVIMTVTMGITYEPHCNRCAKEYLYFECAHAGCDSTPVSWPRWLLHSALTA